MLSRALIPLMALAVACGACMRKPPAEPKRIDEIRQIPPAFKVITYTIQRRDLQATLAKATENSIRLVPVYQNVAAYLTFEHRLFDIRPKSVYSLLGLQNSDLIVAADGYLIKKPEQFTTYVQLLLNEDRANIEIKRDGEARLLKYTFVPLLRPEPTPTQPPGSP